MSTIDLKEIKFKELSAAVVALNNSECFKGKEKIATVGVSKIALVEAFLAAVENVPDNEKGEWTGPQVAGNYYNKIVVVEDPGVIVEVIEKDEESENEIKEIVQTEEDILLSKIENHEFVERPGVIAKDVPKIKDKNKENKKNSIKKSRFDISIELINSLPKKSTKKEWANLANEEYVAKGGKDNKAEFIWAIGIIIEILVKFNLIEISEIGEIKFKER